jgi:acrylyl-CoA reductase (NADPH)
MPFILRGVSLLGIDSVMAPKGPRMKAWERLASDLDTDALAAIGQEIGLGEAIDAAAKFMSGEVKGRYIVDVNR